MAQQATGSPWIDRLRVVVIAGVIVAHTATSYVVDTPWYYEERTTSPVTPVVFGFPTCLAAVYGLGPLFLVAGLLAVTSLARHGPAGFTRSRLLRLGVPAAVHLLLLDPLTRWWGARARGDHRSLADYLLDLTGGRGLGPLWFAVALLVFSLGYAEWRRARPWTARDRDEVIRAGPLIAIVAGIAVIDYLTWQLWSYNTDTFWNFDWPHWPQAAGVFLLGVLAAERGWFRTPPARFARRCGQLTVLGITGLIALAAVSIATGSYAAVAGGGCHYNCVST